MALNACVRQILCTLSFPVLVSIKNTVQPAIAILEASRLQLQGRLAVLNIQVLPIQAARDAALLVLNEANSVATLLPLGLIEGCGDLGDVNATLSAGVERATAAVEDFADDATRALSITAELNAEIAALNTTIANLNEFITILDECITSSLQA